MPKVDVYSIAGEKLETISLNDAIFGIEPNKAVIHEVLVAELAGARQGTRATKTRSEVRGGGRKPFKQKGTGRARAGSTRSPIWVGGGVTFGPQPKDFSKKVNKKVRALAVKSAISEKVNNGDFIVVDSINIDTPKTKTIVEFINKTQIGQKTLFVINNLADDNDWNAYLSIRNIKDTMVLQPSEVGVYWLLKQDKVVVTKEALKAIEEVLA